MLRYFKAKTELQLLETNSLSDVYLQLKAANVYIFAFSYALE